MSKKPRGIKVSYALRIYHETLRLDHLHYGLWDGEPITLEGMRSAQHRYAERLASSIPDGVQTILDVGCGVGTFSKMLLERGYTVEGLSPDPYQQGLYAERVGAPFHLARFQDFQPTKRYDLVMMSEVAQYIWLPSFFPAVLQVVKPGGCLLLADYFRLRGGDGELPKGSGHPLEEFLAAAEEHGCSVSEREDITEATAPTLELATKLLDDHVDPALAMLSEMIADRHPWVHKIGRMLLHKRFAKLIAGREYLDAEEFRKTKRYELLRFEIPS